MASINHIPATLLISGGTIKQKKAYVFTLIRRLLPDPKTAHWLKLSCHPDLLILPNKDQENITIADVREIIQHFHQSAHQGGHKIAVLLATDSMSLGAINALLKIVEEPPAKSFLFLIAEYPHLLPATLRSRCQKVFFPPEKKTSEPLIMALKASLQAVKNGTLSCFDAAQQWQNEHFLTVLNGLFYCLLPENNLFELPEKKFFIFYDSLNAVKCQVLQKQNPNRLLALEYLFYQFYQWQTENGKMLV